MILNAKISRMAIGSLILATAFYIPVIAGLAAVLLGIAARHRISASGGALLGKGMANAGICVGAAQSIIWMALLLLSASFEVPIGTVGVVFRGEIPLRAVGYGSHGKWPIVETVGLYPDGDYQKIESGPEEVVLSNAQLMSVKIHGLWAVCEPMKFAAYFGRIDSLRRAAEEIEQRAWYETRIAASLEPDAKSFHMRSWDIEARLNQDVADHGVCMKGFVATSET